MARFRYSMQSILNIKLKMETQAKQEFSAARAALDEEVRLMAELVARKTVYETESARLLSGALDIKKIEDNRNAILCMEDYIVKQKGQIAVAERKLEKVELDRRPTRMISSAQLSGRKL